MKMRFQIVFFIFSVLISWGFGQNPQFDQGSTGLALALRRLPVTGSILQITAHPDDEDNALLLMMRRGRGFRTGLLTLTRGDGGQNEIGSELFQALGIIRTEELMSVHLYDNARQFFTRAYEFGYSFSVEETIEKWGEEQILEDMVRVIRDFRPQVVVILSRKGKGGGQHHQASALLAEKAFYAAGDSSRFTDHFEEGLRPWKARKLYEQVSKLGRPQLSLVENSSRVLTVPMGLYDPILGKTYAQLGKEARSMHKCQGMEQILGFSGESYSQWQRIFVNEMDRVDPESDLFDGIETSLMRLVHVVKTELDKLPFLVSSVQKIQLAISKAEEVFDPRNPGLTTSFLADGLDNIRRLKTELYASGLDEDDEYEIFFLLKKKEEDFIHALNLSNQLTLEILADDGVVSPGQDLELIAALFNGGNHPVVIDSWEVVTDEDSKFSTRGLPGSSPLELGPGQFRTYKIPLRVNSDARATEPYWSGPKETIDQFKIKGNDASLPWGRPELAVKVGYRSFGVESNLRALAEYRYSGPWVGGEQRHDVMVVPTITLVLEPTVRVISLDDQSSGIKLAVRVKNNGKKSISGVLSLEIPDGWRVDPASHRLSFKREEEKIFKSFRVFPAKNISVGTFQVEAVAELEGKIYASGYQIIDYDHIRRRHLFSPSQAKFQVVDLKVDRGLRVGYIEGVGDYVLEALKQLGVDVEQINSYELSSNELNNFDTIFTGIRAYLKDEYLKAYNDRLLNWVKQGGTLIVQYNKLEFNGQVSGDRLDNKGASPFAPFPAKVSHNRVTDETAPIKILAPLHPVFNMPNRIGPKDWNGWVQERGLYFLGKKDPLYQDLISIQDPFPFNSGEKRGALVEARYGKGHWIYVGLNLWRQLQTGVPGSYRLLANLVSLGQRK